MIYLALIHKESESDFGVSFPDFPGCITASHSLWEAKPMAAEALRGHIAAMRAAGLPLPEPSTLGAIMQHEDYADSLGVLPVRRRSPRPRHRTGALAAVAADPGQAGAAAAEG
jgi:predicted RNase H-like HicB family nuclease